MAMQIRSKGGGKPQRRDVEQLSTPVIPKSLRIDPEWVKAHKTMPGEDNFNLPASERKG
jgi:hypothetical protein